MTPALAEFYAYWGDWFSQPVAEKLKHAHVSGKGGHYPPGSEGPGLNGKRDKYKEYFHWRPFENPPDSAGPTLEVFLQCVNTAREWLESNGLHEIADIPARNHVLRILHYLPSPDGCVGEAHRDFDLLTVSVAGTAPGLEVWESAYEGGTWEPQESGIQVGEMLEEYTRNDLNCDVLHIQCGHPWKCGHQDQSACTCHRSDPLRATTHRVRTAPNTDRLKAVFFYLPPGDFELRPGFTANDYLSGPNGVLRKAGTYK